jgi:hypothetical protein
MGNAIFVLIAVIIAFAFLWFVFSRKNYSDAEDVETFVCSECGEKHCNCYKEDPQKRESDFDN